MRQAPKKASWRHGRCEWIYAPGYARCVRAAHWAVEGKRLCLLHARYIVRESRVKTEMERLQ